MEQVDFGYGRLGQFHRRSGFQACQVAYRIRARFFPKRISVSSFWALPKEESDAFRGANTAVMQAITHCKHNKYSYIDAPTPTFRRFGTPNAREVS
jgi:hypothetical protein